MNKCIMQPILNAIQLTWIKILKLNSNTLNEIEIPLNYIVLNTIFFFSTFNRVNILIQI